MTQSRKLPYFMAIMAFFIFVIGTIASFLSYPGYSFEKEYTSDLVRGPHPYIFKVTAISAGILLLPFYPNLFSQQELTNDLFPNKIGQVIGVFSILGLIMLGIFDINQYYFAHQISAGIFFLGTAIALMLWIYSIFLSKENNIKQSTIFSNIIQIFFLFAFVILIFYFIFSAGLYGPVIQKIIIYGLIIYAALYSLNMIE